MSSYNNQRPEDLREDLSLPPISQIFSSCESYYYKLPLILVAIQIFLLAVLETHLSPWHPCAVRVMTPCSIPIASHFKIIRYILSLSEDYSNCLRALGSGCFISLSGPPRVSRPSESLFSVIFPAAARDNALRFGFQYVFAVELTFFARPVP